MLSPLFYARAMVLVGRALFFVTRTRRAQTRHEAELAACKKVSLSSSPGHAEGIWEMTAKSHQAAFLLESHPLSAIRYTQCQRRNESCVCLQPFLQIHHGAVLGADFANSLRLLN